MNDTHPANNEVTTSLAEVEPPSWLDRCERFCLIVLDRLEIRHWELSILFCNDRFIRELNRKYRGLDSPTDVLSFRQEDEAAPFREEGSYRPVGDIAISLDTLERNTSTDEEREVELKRLLIHGILHIQGMDHPEVEEGGEPSNSRMLELQESLIDELKEERIF